MITGASAGVGRALARAGGDAGAHGDFDAASRGLSVQLGRNRHRRWFADAGGAAALAALGARASRFACP